jgi:hypothetical protein
MKRIWVGCAEAALLVLLVGCPKPTAWEIADEAFGPESKIEKAEGSREIDRGLKRADEEIRDNPKEARPYVAKAQLLWMKGDHPQAVETLHDALDKAETKTEAEKERIKLYLLWAYRASDTPNMLKKGILYVEDLIKKETMKTVYCYHMGVYYRRLHKILGEGFYKSEANRWFLACGPLDPDIEAELKREGLKDPFMK